MSVSTARARRVNDADRACGRHFLLENWITIRGSTSTVGTVTQSQEHWLEIPDFADATFWIDVAEVTAPANGLVILNLESSPTCDETFFQPVSGIVPLVASTVPTVVKTTRAGTTVPLARYLRWRITTTGSGAWDATFRIRAVGNRTSYFVPTSIAGCVYWMRGDLGLTLSGTTVTNIADLSGTGDSNKNLAAGTSTPSLTVNDSNYASQLTVSFSGNANCYYTSGTWASSLSQPFTWIYVGHHTSQASTEYFMDGDTSGFGFAVFANTNSSISMVSTATITTSTSFPWTSPSGLLCEVNSTSSNVFVNNFSSAAASGNVGTTAHNSMTLGAHSIAFGGGSNWIGTITEVIAYSGLLSTSSKTKIKQYLNARYGLSIS